MIETIREKCIEANPEIVELKFGCEVKEKYANTVDVLIDITDEDGVEMYFTKYYPDGLSSEWQIIGRPIHLADVLLAMKDTARAKDVYIKGGLFCTGLPISPSSSFVHCNWDLKDDNLDHQSPETIEFIHSLLK